MNRRDLFKGLAGLAVVGPIAAATPIQAIGVPTVIGEWIDYGGSLATVAYTTNGDWRIARVSPELLADPAAWAAYRARLRAENSLEAEIDLDEAVRGAC